ncbi:site-specific integrase [Ktedonobacter robiniae]|uniref:Site-specific integrase n=1 Tax=Ktedonobacter robiniae TaxID=2778365 RepID=A0ABQ3V2G1_9CHLR|nr:site-specific integrase [Ktedonobacter robiniae]GHO59168.1 site-specific integrase [Ktedonobacter robiniae]
MAKMTKRRDYGEGSVYRRSDGRYAATVRINGKRITRYAKDEKAANALRKQLLKEAEQGLNLQAPKYTVKEYLEYWLEVHRPTIRATTYVSYSFRILQLGEVFGRTKLRDLKADKIQLSYGKMLEAGVAASTIRLNHRILKKALRDAVSWGYLIANPALGVTPPKEGKREYPILTLDESAKLLAVAEGHYIRPLLALTLATGMRKGEILGLRWSAIDFEAQTLYVNVSASYIKVNGIGLVVENEPKTASGRRTISLPDFVIEELRRHKIQQAEVRKKAGLSWVDKGLVFTNVNGNYISASTVKDCLSHFLEKAGLPRMRFHDLRHSLASILLAINVHPKVVQEILGHSSVAITMNIYSHLLPSMHTAAIQDLDRQFKQAQGD